jgi:4-hydroxyphenylpyruvate dioxygenase
MKTSIATVSLSGDLQGKLDAISSAGFDGFELFENDLTFSQLRPTEVRARYESLGLTLFALQPFRDFEGLLDAKRSAAFDRAERKFDLMEQLGTDLLLIPSSVSPHATDSFDRYASDLRELGDRAKARGFRVGYEALAWGRHVRDWTQAWDIVQRADHSNIGLVLDTYHLFVRGNPIAPVRNVPANKIFMVQLADAPSLDMEVLRHSRHLRNFPGQGDYPIVDFMIELTATGYNDVLSHEIFNDDFRVAPAAQTAVDGYRSMIWLEEQLTKTLASKPVPSPNIASWTPTAGHVAQVKFGAVSFVEFAVTTQQEAEELAAFFGQLGFAHSHHHRTKNVNLFSRGGIYLAVNAEPESYASSFAERHGAAACAIGIETSNPAAAVARSIAYGANAIPVASGPGQLPMPAITGAGGALIYFVDTLAPHYTESDFDHVAATRGTTNSVSSPAGGSGNPSAMNGSSESDRVTSARVASRSEALRFDHIAQAVAPHEVLSMLLFYRTVLGFNLQPPLELVDPNGLVTSRTVVSANGAIRFPLNSAASGDTSPERFRHTTHGAGVQHIALATDSIAKLVVTIDPSIVLSIPENYYDDVAARFALDEPTLGFLKANNVLYDRTDEGEFFHLYTQEIHGVFFEFVQRNSYSGFGAANAPVRLAAQSRTRQPVGVSS